jgi:lambda family phage portal protein
VAGFTDLLAIVSPKAAYARAAWKAGYDGLKGLEGERRYAAAERGRLTSAWRAGNGSPDAELINDLPLIRARCGQMVRDNKYAATAVRNLVAWLVGDGIAARAHHKDKAVAALAQEIWDAHVKTRVDGRDDHYGVQKMMVRTMIVRGDALQVWRADRGMPDARVQVLAGDHLANITRRLDSGGRIVGGVEYDRQGVRVAYHIYPDHPGDILGTRQVQPERIAAEYVDHLFEALDAGQSRGVPWFHMAIRDLREVEDVKASVRIQKKVQACLALFRRPPEGVTPSPLGERKEQERGPAQETLKPGMIINGLPGEEAPTVINPSSSGDGDGFLRAELTAIAAAFGVPAHVMTGDVSQANYSSLRAAIVVWYKLLDDWTFNVIVPHLLDPTFERVMRRASLMLGIPALAKVTAVWTPPPRPWVDPLKDIAAEILEARAIPGALLDALTARGESLETAVAKQALINKAFDREGVTSDADPRRINGSGGLQPPAGYIAPKADAA